MRKHIGPGPGAYLLPPTVGFPNHDPSRYRNPQYSFRYCRRGFDAKTLGVGPAYATAGYTQHGRLTSPAYTLKSRAKELTVFRPPGPGTYSPSPPKVMPAYSIRSRPQALVRSITPGPDRYMLPTTIGPKVPDKIANPGFSMSVRHVLAEKERSPGPAKYGGLNMNAVNNKNPMFSMIGRHYMPAGKALSPGPAAYLPSPPRKGTGGYPFGVKVETDPYITADDEMPCISR